MELTAKQYELLEVISRQDVSQESWDDTDNLYQLGLMMEDKILSARIFRAARRFGLDRQDLLGAITQARRNKNGYGVHAEDALYRPKEEAGLETLLSHEEPRTFIEALVQVLHAAVYPAEVLHAPSIMQRCGQIKRQQRALYKGRLWPKIKAIKEMDPWEWDREVDRFAYATDRLLTVPLSSIPEEDIDWLWGPYVPLKKLTLVEGDPEAGKTYILLALAAAVTQGYCLPDQDGHVAHAHGQSGNVLYITAEDGLADTIRKRARRCKADLNRIYVVPQASMFPEDVQPFSLARPHLLNAAIEERQAKLVILDPLTAFLGADMDMHRANEVRPIMSILAGMAERNNCAVIGVRHWTKVIGGKAAYRGQGNIDFLAAARCVLAVGKSPEDETLRIMAQSKNSISERGISIVFKISDEGLEWAGTSFMTADELSAAQPHLHKKQRQNAMEWLKDYLRSGPQQSTIILEAAKAVGITDKGLRRAKEALGILATKEGNAWYWRLPKFQQWDRYAGMEDDDDVIKF
jgi:archaellum biogenesis ATPase FlaH